MSGVSAGVERAPVDWQDLELPDVGPDGELLVHPVVGVRQC